MNGTILCLLLGQSIPLGFFPGGAEKELEAERLLLSIPSPDGFGAHLLHLTEEPHPAGSKRNMELADYVRSRFVEYGLEEMHFHARRGGRRPGYAMIEPV